MRHISNRRIYPRGRPQMLHRLRTRTAYLRRCSRYGMHVLDTDYLLSFAELAHYLRNGIPNSASSRRPSSSVLAVVTTVTAMPRTLSILS